MKRLLLLPVLASAFVLPAAPASAEWCDRLAVNVSCLGPDGRYCDAWVRATRTCVVLKAA